jgi:hypothetical protein
VSAAFCVLPPFLKGGGGVGENIAACIATGTLTARPKAPGLHSSKATECEGLTDRLVACFKHPEESLFADVSSRWPGFIPIAVYVGFVVDKLETWFFFFQSI